MQSTLLPELLNIILDLLPDIRILSVSRATHAAVRTHSDCVFWRKHRLTLQNICQYGNPKMLELVRYDKQVAFASAAEHGNLGVIQYLVENFVLTYDYGYALKRASRFGHLSVVQYLHGINADIHVDGDRPLSRAAEHGHLGVVRYLHGARADISVRENEPLRYAAERGHLDVVRYLHGAGVDIQVGGTHSIRFAAQCGYLDVVEYLHGAGVDIMSDTSLLAQTCRHGQLGVLKYLHGAGVDIRADNDKAARMAASHDRVDIFAYLYNHGVDMIDGRSAIDWVIANNYIAAAEYLYDRGVTDISCDTVADAALECHVEAIVFLQQRGVDITGMIRQCDLDDDEIEEITDFLDSI